MPSLFEPYMNTMREAKRERRKKYSLLVQHFAVACVPSTSAHPFVSLILPSFAVASLPLAHPGMPHVGPRGPATRAGRRRTFFLKNSSISERRFSSFSCTTCLFLLLASLAFAILSRTFIRSSSTFFLLKVVAKGTE